MSASGSPTGLAGSGTPPGKGLVYYTIYTKGLNTSSGYIDVALADDQLFKDYLQYLDVGIKPVRSYVVIEPPMATGRTAAATGLFSINLGEVSAMTIVKPA